MTALGDRFDLGDSEPVGVLGVKSLVWVDLGEGFELVDVEDGHADDDDLTPLSFGKTTAGSWKFYLSGKTYVDWETVVRRFGPVRVTMLDSAS